MNRRVEKLKKFMAFADSLWELSTCKRAQCSAILFTPDYTEICGIGYNGQPKGSPHDSCTNTEGTCGCVHAEANAILKCRSVRKDLIMYSSTFPCPLCAGLIANDGRVSFVLYRNWYRDMRTNIFVNAGIRYVTTSALSPSLTDIDMDIEVTK